jgi:hypothetical protein
MSLPGFNAEASLFRIRGNYRLPANNSCLATPQVYAAALTKPVMQGIDDCWIAMTIAQQIVRSTGAVSDAAHIVHIHVLSLPEVLDHNLQMAAQHEFKIKGNLPAQAEWNVVQSEKSP